MPARVAKNVVIHIVFGVKKTRRNAISAKMDFGATGVRKSVPMNALAATLTMEHVIRTVASILEQATKSRADRQSPPITPRLASQPEFPLGFL